MAAQLDEVSIRPARAEDADDIARVDIASWRGAYSEILPGSYLSSLDAEERATLWRDAVATESTRILVAETDEGTVGFTSVGPSRDEDADDGDLEIYAIYLHPEAWGSGVARELMRQVLGSVPRGASVTLWILEENKRAQHFYRRHGFAPDGTERIDEIGGRPMTQVRYRR
ncbi:GNAT family N-acetyltransferase [Myceligenerans indicum]|uniref:GNAT family N-acetyltransferase n=1 Tax=Myceligenerans indicum TaxID=2593663 RepID=A0ABS1LP47_9MICO|nr:N-acetyltransferase [Myceligenerans indicum]MBL0887999.1 GNAT family N-acetyltransferase [Myceligenerans indicum]